MRPVKTSRWYVMAVLLAVWPLCGRDASTQQKKSPQAGSQPAPTLQASAPAACIAPCQFRFVVYGDTRDGHETHRNIVKTVLDDYAPSLILQTGDLVNPGYSLEEWKAFKKDTERIPPDKYYPAPGNHDKCTNQESIDYFRNHIPERIRPGGNKLYYAFDYPSGTAASSDRVIIRFIAIDTVQAIANCDPGTSEYPPGKVDDTQLAWLARELKTANDEHKVVVPFFHHPIYSTGKHGSYDNLSRGELEKLFKSNGVRLVFQGHDHNYYYTERDSITYVVSGGGGAGLRGEVHKEQANTEKGAPDVFMMAYNFSVGDVYSDKIKVTTYASTKPGEKFKQVDKFEIPLAKKK